jgi:hypothetical protein
MLFILRISFACMLAAIASASDAQRFGFVEWALCLFTIFVLVFWNQIGVLIDGQDAAGVLPAHPAGEAERFGKREAQPFLSSAE